MARWIEKQFDPSSLAYSKDISQWLNELEEQEEVLDVYAVSFTTERWTQSPNTNNKIVLVRLADKEEEEENVDYYTLQQSIDNSVN